MANCHPPAAIRHLLLCFSLFFFCYLNRYCVYGARQVTNHRDEQPNSREILLQDEFRARSLKSIEVADDYGEGIRLPLTPEGDDNFLVTVGFGTPKRDYTLIFDTGSDLTWVQCQPCSAPNCNPQVPSFDPSSSSTFSNVVCHPDCNYTMGYHDGTSSRGYYANDTLTITTNPYPYFIFGCAQKISGNFGGASGLLGVGGGSNSLVAQTDLNFFSVFCYCLPATDSSTGFVVFGVQAYETCQPDENKMIPLIGAANDLARNSYYVMLDGITIGQQRLPMSSPLKAIIDSGTTISRLPSILYSALGSAFKGLMSQYTPIASPFLPLLDTCYNLEGHNNWTPPSLVLHFEGSKGTVDVALDSSAVALRSEDSQVYCLAFAGNKDRDDLTIIGNKQHRALNLLFDINNKEMTFVGGGCSSI